MKKFILICLIYFPLHATTDMITNELSMLDNLIDVTKQNLENELTLKKQIETYRQLQQEYLKSDDDKEKLYKLVHQAQRIQDKIQSSYLMQTFSPEFLSEIDELSQMASKREMPKP